ncbi:MAG: O-methyltransferase [Hyphomonadaceae bacterium]|nr:O-methyltransferase [Clostridia bacterium]
MIEEHINQPFIIDYIRNLLPKQADILEEMKAFAQHEDTYAPIVQPEVAQMLTVLCKMVNPTTILEIGTAIGYSAIVMATATQNVQKLVTVERYDKMAALARQNVQKAGLESIIQIVEADAVAWLPTVQGTFDLIFLDAAKGQYLEFLPHCLRLLKQGGVLISDNILYKGMIAAPHLVIRRKITIVKRIRKYLIEIMNHPALDTSIIPIGDGVAISYKR